MTIATELDIRPLSPMIGAEIHGIDLRRPLGAPVVAQVRQALNDHHVIFFRDQELTPDPAGRLRPAVRHGHRGPPGDPGHRGATPTCWPSTAARTGPAGGIPTSPSSQTPAFGSILYMLERPEVGGDTTWASLQDAYDRLAEPVPRHVRHADRHPLRPLVRRRRRGHGWLRVAGGAPRQASARPPPGGAHPSRERAQRPLRQPAVHPDRSSACRRTRATPCSTCSTGIASSRS